MNRRNFLKLIPAAIAAPIIAPFLKSDPVEAVTGTTSVVGLGFEPRYIMIAGKDQGMFYEFESFDPDGFTIKAVRPPD